MRATDARAPLLAVGVALFAGWQWWGFLGEGLPTFFDAHSHYARAGFAAQAFDAGELPTWTQSWYGGYRLLEIYSPGHYWLTGAIGLLVGDVARAVKLVLFGSLLVSALGVYALTLRVAGNALVSAFAAALLVRCAEPLLVLGVIGNHPSALIYAVTPWVLYTAARAARDAAEERRRAAARALLWAALVFAHFSNALLLFPALVACELAWLAARPAEGRRRGLLGLGASLAALTVLTAMLALPFLGYLPRASLSLASLPIHLSLRPLAILTGLSPSSWGLPFVANHGTGWCVLGLVGALLSLTPAARAWRPLAVGLLVALLSVWLLGERAALGVAFLLFPLCAAPLAWASRVAAGRGLPASLLPVAALAAACVWSTRDAELRPRYEPADALAPYAKLPETPTRSRTFDVTPKGVSLHGLYGASSASPLLSGRAIPFGGFPQGVPLAGIVKLALAGRLVTELRAGGLTDPGLDLLYLWHVQFLVDRREEPVLARLSRDVPGVRRLEAGVLRLDHASPALFSQRLSPLPERYRRPGQEPQLLAVLRERWQRAPLPGPDPALALTLRAGARPEHAQLLPLLQAMEIDRAGGRAGRLFAERPLAHPAPAVGAADDASFSVQSHREEGRRVEIVARASHSGFLRLSYAHDPELRVSLDRVPASSVPDALGGALVLAFPAGTHSVVLEAPRAVLRQALLVGAGLASALLIALAAGFPRRRNPRVPA